MAPKAKLRDEKSVNLGVLDFLSILRRNAKTVILCVVAGIAAGLLYIASQESMYTARAQLMIGPQLVNPLRDQTSELDARSSQLDPTMVDSALEVLRSDQVGLEVVAKLPPLQEKPMGTVTYLKSIFRSFIARVANGANGEQRLGDVVLRKKLMRLEELGRELSVIKLARTNILQVEYSAPSPVGAAQIANAYVDSYLAQEVRWRLESAMRAQQWLSARIDELQDPIRNADRAVQQFRSDHDLLIANDIILNEQQLNDLGTSLSSARDERSRAEARYERIKNSGDNPGTTLAAAALINNPILTDLRVSLLDVVRRRTELELKVGPEQTGVDSLNLLIAKLEGLLSLEVKRSAEVARGDYESALSREKALGEELQLQRNRAAADNGAKVQLQLLEKKAESLHTLHQKYVELQEEAGRQKSFPMSNAIVVSSATPPLWPSRPRLTLVLAYCALLGGIIGILGALYGDASRGLNRAARR